MYKRTIAFIAATALSLAAMGSLPAMMPVALEASPQGSDSAGKTPAADDGERRGRNDATDTSPATDAPGVRSESEAREQTQDADDEASAHGDDASDRGPWSRRRPARPLGEAQMNDALEMLEHIKPELAERLESLRAEDPTEARRLLHQRLPHVRHLLWLKESDPDMYELRVADMRLSYRARDLAQRHQEAVEAGDRELAETLRDELALLLEEHFEVRQRIRQRELERLEQHLAALRRRIEARDDERQQIIEQRLDELTASENHGQR